MADDTKKSAPTQRKVTLLHPHLHPLTIPWRRAVLLCMHVGVILGSAGLIGLITVDTIRNISFLADDTYLTIQFWICIFFILDVVVECVFTPKRWHYLLTHLFFLIISIPYLNIVSAFHIHVTPQVAYAMRFIPMLRAAYVLAIIAGAMQANWVRSMFSAYIVVLVASVYFGSLMFYVEEHYINTMVTDYWAALWWAILNLTTVGCEISPITPTGKVLAVLLSAGGLILFPLFTVYLTDVMSNEQKSETDNQQPQPAKA